VVPPEQRFCPFYDEARAKDEQTQGKTEAKEERNGRKGGAAKIAEKLKGAWFE
jgi:hypothetical protein